jgi:hypothetical protein
MLINVAITGRLRDRLFLLAKVRGVEVDVLATRLLTAALKAAIGAGVRMNSGGER